MKQIKLTPYENAIENKAETVIPYPKNHPLYQIVENAAKQTALSKPISIRLNIDILDRIKKQAKNEGIPYQTLIKSVLHQYMNNI